MAQLRSAFAMILAGQTNPKVVLRELPLKRAGTASDQTPEPEPLIENQTPAAAPSPAIPRLPPELMIVSQAPRKQKHQQWRRQRYNNGIR